LIKQDFRELFIEAEKFDNLAVGELMMITKL